MATKDTKDTKSQQASSQEEDTKRVSINLPTALLAAAVKWGKARKISTQSELFETLIEMGLDGCPGLNVESTLGYNLDDYFQYKEGTYQGPDGATIEFVGGSAKNELEEWICTVTLDGRTLYTAGRGRPIGSETPLSFGSYQ